MATQNSKPLLHRKEMQMMSTTPVTIGAGMFVISDQSDIAVNALFVTSSTVHYLYNHNEDGFTQIPSGAFAGTFGAGSCGVYHPWSIAYTANGGSTTSATVSAASFNINGLAVGSTIEFISSGTNNGQRRTILSIINNAGANTITLNFAAVNTAVLNTHTFRLSTGKFYVMNAGTIAAGIWKVFDLGTMNWQANLGTTNLPATWGTDGRLAHAHTAALLAPPTTAGVNVATGTASSGSTTTLVDSGKAWITNNYAGWYVAIISGTGVGQLIPILSNTATTLTFATVTTAPDATSVYEIRTRKAFSFSKATAGAATTLTDSTRTWTVNQWTNSQVRIVAGTGVGQTRTISSNTATILTVSASWGTNPDLTSIYEIEGNEDFFYLIGNNVVTMYRYSISANTWTVMAPTVARAAAPTTGISADWVGVTGDPNWGNESAILDGRYIYSMRGNVTAVISQFDIAGGTSGAGAWADVTYVGTETFTVGSSATIYGGLIYIRKDATNRFFKYNIPGNFMDALTSNLYTDGTAVVGDRIWTKSLDAPGVIKWLYMIRNSGTEIHRVMLF